MERQEVAKMLRFDAAQLHRVVIGETAELRLSQVAPEMIRHLNLARGRIGTQLESRRHPWVSLRPRGIAARSVRSRLQVTQFA